MGQSLIAMCCDTCCRVLLIADVDFNSPAISWFSQGVASSDSSSREGDSARPGSQQSGSMGIVLLAPGFGCPSPKAVPANLATPTGPETTWPRPEEIAAAFDLDQGSTYISQRVLPLKELRNPW